jgi:hypothetical protein
MQTLAAAADTPKKEIDVAEKLHVVPNNGSKSSAVDDEEAFDNYPIVAAIAGWDQIGSLSSEVSTSVLAKQASIISERFREENRGGAERLSKRRKMAGTPSDGCDDDEQQQVVLSRDKHSSTSSAEPLPDFVSHQVDRMARMSELMLQMESYHRAVRMEMIAMAKEDSGGINLEFP